MLLLVSLWGWRLSRDVPDPGDGDLLPARAELAPSDNAYAALGAALAEAKRLDPAWSPGSWDAGQVGGEEGRAVYQMLEEALARPALQFPSPGVEDPLLVELIGLAQLLDLRARLHAERGSLDAAFADAHRTAALGERLATGEGVTLVSAIIGARIQELGLARIRSLLRAPGATAVRISGWLRQLGDRPIPLEARRRVWSGEYAAFKTQFTAGMQEHREGTPFFLRSSPGGYFYQHNRTLAMIADSFRGYRDAAASCGEAVPDPPAEMTPVDYIRPNAVGEILARVAAPAYQRYLEKFCGLEVHRVASRSVLALHAYRLDHGDYPDALDALVPSYLAAAPTDPFDGAPLRYSRQTLRVWSVGTDRVDAGGERPDTADRALEEISLPLESELEVADLK